MVGRRVDARGRHRSAQLRRGALSFLSQVLESDEDKNEVASEIAVTKVLTTEIASLQAQLEQSRTATGAVFFA